MPSTAPTVIRLADYRPPEFLIDAVALSFRLAAAETQVAATLELRRNPAATRGDGALRLDGEGLALEWDRPGRPGPGDLMNMPSMTKP